MVTSLPTITVGPVEAGGGFSVICSACGWRALRPMRETADMAAVAHYARHGQPDPAERVA